MFGRWTLALVLIVAANATPAAWGQGSTYNFSSNSRGTRLWIPDGLETIRGILISGNGAGGDSRNEVSRPIHQAFAKTHGFAIVATSMWGNLAGSELSIWDSHLASLATLSGYPELIHAPYAPVGFSNGGQMSYGFNALRPEKTIAFIANKGCCYNVVSPSDAALATPGILIAGEVDTQVRRDNIRNMYQSNRARGALWSWIEQPGVAHADDANELVLPFMSEAIRLRYPVGAKPTATQGVTLQDVDAASGWLADNSTWKSGLAKVYSPAEYPGDPAAASWLLNEPVARVFQAFSTYGRTAALTFSRGGLDQQTGEGMNPVTLFMNMQAATGWQTATLFDFDKPVQTFAAAEWPGLIFPVSVPISRLGAHAFSMRVEFTDGRTSASNPVAYYATAVPEPQAMTLSAVGAAWLLGRKRRRRRRGICPNSAL